MSSTMIASGVVRVRLVANTTFIILPVPAEGTHTESCTKQCGTV